MNICMVAYTFYDGDNRVMRYAEALAARGDRVDVIALRQPHETEAYQLLHGVNVYRVQSRAYNEHGLKSYLIRVASFFLRTFWLLNKRHRKIHYDVVHVHSVPDLLVFTALIPKLTGAKVILDIHDLLPELFTAKFVGRSHAAAHKALVLVERVCAWFADHVIAANDLWRDKLIARGSVRSQKCSVMLNFPDPSIFQISKSLEKNGKKFTMIYPGTLNWHQGLDIAVHAFASISSEVPDSEFHIYGDGSAKANLVKLTEELGMQDRIVFHKCVPLRSIAPIMAEADLAIVPKRNDSFGGEAFSTKTLEFMMLGVPLILADTRIDKHYFDDSIVRFFRSGDENSLAAAMVSLINDSEGRKQLARNAQDYVKGQSWEIHKCRYLGLVDSLVPIARHASRVATIGQTLNH